MDSAPATHSDAPPRARFLLPLVAFARGRPSLGTGLWFAASTLILCGLWAAGTGWRSLTVADPSAACAPLLILYVTAILPVPLAFVAGMLLGPRLVCLPALDSRHAAALGTAIGLVTAGLWWATVWLQGGLDFGPLCRGEPANPALAFAAANDLALGFAPPLLALHGAAASVLARLAPRDGATGSTR